MSAKRSDILLYGGATVVALGVGYWVVKSAKGAEKGTQNAIENFGKQLGTGIDTGAGAAAGGLTGLIVGAIAAPETGGVSLIAWALAAVGAIAGGGIGYEVGKKSVASTSYSAPVYQTTDDFTPSILGS